MATYLERALFIVAPQNAGKSSTLRSIFLDRRLGLGSEIPTAAKLKDCFYIGHERRLHVRLSSPHESGDTPTIFIRKSKDKMRFPGRWCYAGALQPEPFKKMPGVVESVRTFVAELAPERTRVVFLSPERDGFSKDERIALSLQSIDELFAVPGVEVMTVDGRKRQRNGLMLADFFDFT